MLRFVSLVFAFLMLVSAAPAQNLADQNVAIPEQPVSAPREFRITHLWQIQSFPPSQFLKKENFMAAKYVGITSLVSFVHWSDVEPLGPDSSSFDQYTGMRANLNNYRLKWTPVLITNPFSSTPDWFKNSNESVMLRCLECDEETPVQSIWNPNLRPHIRRFLRKMAEYCHERPDLLESVRLGIGADFGEAVFPSKLGLNCPDSTHVHEGWWAGDRYAREDFRRWLRDRYRGVEGIAKAWGIPAASVDQIATATGNLVSLPDEKLAGVYIADASGLDEIHARRFEDFVTWYQDSMTQYARQWLADVRDFFPGDRLELVLSGNGDPRLGADLTALAKVAGEYQAGLCAVMASNDYLSGFVPLRLVSSAARGYGTHYGTEEYLPNSEKGISCRFFDAMSGGATLLGFRSLYDVSSSYGSAKPLKAMEEYIRQLPRLKPLKPDISIAVYYPARRIRMFPSFLPTYHSWLKRLRDCYDFDLVDERMIEDGLLSRYRMLVRLPMSDLPQESDGVVREFVEKGGVEILHAGQAEQDELVDHLGRPKTIVIQDIGTGHRAIYGIPAENEYSQFSPRLLSILNGTRMPWSEISLPDRKTDGVYLTRFTDGSMAVFNSLDSPCETAIYPQGKDPVSIRLEAREFRLISGPNSPDSKRDSKP